MSAQRTLIGEGGFGRVFAETRADGVTVVVKVVTTYTHGDVRRATHEANVLASLTHPCIPAFLDFSQQHDCCEITLEYVGSRSLFDVLVSNDAIAPVFVATTFVCLASALAHMHAQGMAHMDVKSENVVVHDDGRACLVDFNLTYVYAPREPLLVPLGSRGTQSHAAPEVLAKVPFNAYQADAWSLGVTCFAVLHRKLPFHCATPNDALYAKFASVEPQRGVYAALAEVYPNKLAAPTGLHASLMEGLLRVDAGRRVPMTTTLSLATAHLHAVV